MSGILAGIFENRARAGGAFHVSQTPPGWIKSFGYDVASGVTVNEATALQFSAVFACVRILAESVASLPLHVYQRVAGGGKARAVNHYLYPILHDLPNPEMTSYDLREVLMGHLTTWGNAFGEIEINRAGEVMALWPLRPDRMTVARVSGRLTYTYRLKKADAQGRMEISLPAERVFHLRGLGFDGVMGYSPIEMARQAIGLGLAAEEFGSRFFGNDARPGVVLQHPGKLSDEAHKRLTESWESRHQGLDKSHRVGVLEEGLTVHEIGLPPEDAQFLETRKFQVTEIARIYRVPPHMLADLERATFSNIEHQSLEFVIHTLRPWLVRWEQAISAQLLTPMERRVYFPEHLVDGLLRGDVASRYNAYSVGRQNGWLSANDIRRLENMNPVEGGDVYLVPLNMIPANQVGAGIGGSAGQQEEGRATTLYHPVQDSARVAPTTTRDDGTVRAEQAAIYRHRLMGAHFRVYQDVAARVLRREVADVGRAVRRFGGRQDYDAFTLWLAEFYREHPEFVWKQFEPLAMSYGELVAAAAQEEIGGSRQAPDGLTPELERWIGAYLGTFAARHSIVSESRIRAAAELALAQGGDPMAAIEEELGTWEDRRSAETARWESVRFSNALAVAVYGFAGVVRKRWVAIGKSCPYCANLDGRIVGTSHFFINAGTEWQPEGADRPLNISHNVGHAPAHDGCDCMVVAGF